MPFVVGLGNWMSIKPKNGNRIRTVGLTNGFQQA
jgi:hypothetical protein